MQAHVQPRGRPCHHMPFTTGAFTSPSFDCMLRSVTWSAVLVPVGYKGQASPRVGAQRLTQHTQCAGIVGWHVAGWVRVTNTPDTHCAVDCLLQRLLLLQKVLLLLLPILVLLPAGCFSAKRQGKVDGPCAFETATRDKCTSPT